MLRIHDSRSDEDFASRDTSTEFNEDSADISRRKYHESFSVSILSVPPSSPTSYQRAMDTVRSWHRQDWKILFTELSREGREVEKGEDSREVAFARAVVYSHVRASLIRLLKSGYFRDIFEYEDRTMILSCARRSFSSIITREIMTPRNSYIIIRDNCSK